MALHEKTESNAKFLTIKHHSIVMESKTPVEGWEEVHPANPKDKKPDGTLGTVTKWIKRFAAVDGKIRRLEWYDRTYGSDRFMGVKIHLKDNGEYFSLDLPMNSRAFGSFIKLVENIDFDKVVEFSAWHNRKDDQTAFAVRQDGEYVKWKYTKDDMGDCPPPKQSRIGKWDFSDQEEFLVSRLLDVVIPHVDALNEFDEPMPEYTDDPQPVKAQAAKVSGEPDMPPFNPSDDDIPW